MMKTLTDNLTTIYKLKETTNLELGVERSCTVFGYASHVLTRVHLQVVVDDLEEFRRLGDSARFKFGSNWHVIDRNLKSSRGDKLTFHCIADEEEHHASIHLVFKGPHKW